MRTTFTNESGVTLLELTIASAVLAVGFVLVFGSIFSIIEASDAVEDRAVATVHLAGVMEELREASYSQLLVYEPPAVEGLRAGATTQVQCYSDGGEAVVLPTDPDAMEATPLPNPCEVQVTVSWRDKRLRPMTASSSAFLWR